MVIVVTEYVNMLNIIPWYRYYQKLSIQDFPFENFSIEKLFPMTCSDKSHPDAFL